MQRPKVLLFDLGGVIVRWVGLDELAKLTGLTRDVVIERFAASHIFNDYEVGECSDDIFADELIALFELDVSREKAKSLWNSWVQDCYLGTKEALQTLRNDYTIACLSNTNALHWEHLKTHIDVDQYFDYSYASHIICAAKPAPKSYRFPLDDMKVKAEDIWFFDDTQANVRAAEALGIKAFHIDRDVGAIPTLKHLGLLG